LVEFDNEGRRKAALLSAWEVSNDGLTVRLHLDDNDHIGVHDITAGDLATNIHHLLTAAPQSPPALILSSISGADRFLAEQVPWLPGVNVPDDWTLEIHLEHRQPLLLDALADIRVSPVRAVAEPNDVLTDLGAVQFGAGRNGVLTANGAFAGGRPFIDSVAIRRGNRLPADDRLIIIDPSKSAEAGSPSVVYPGARCVYLVFHPAGAVRDSAQRTALLGTIDPESMVRIFFGNSGTRLTSLVPPSAVPIELIGEVVSNDVAGSAGVRTLRLAHPAGSAELRLVAERIKVDMLVAGIDVRLVEYRGERLPSCDLFLFDALIADHAPEYTLWCALVRHARMVGDGAEAVPPSGDALAWLRALTQQRNDSLDIVPLLQLRHSVALDASLRGIRFRFDGTLDLENAWIAPEGAQR
jgi:MarR-like DNA-binding transcriptional regulator SgrR of sgrS sRNA